MSAFFEAKTDAARKSAIVKILTDAASEGGALLSSTGARIRGPLHLSDIRAAIGGRSADASRLVNELVDATTIVRDMHGSGDVSNWTYTVA